MKNLKKPYEILSSLHKWIVIEEYVNHYWAALYFASDSQKNLLWHMHISFLPDFYYRYHLSSSAQYEIASQ